MRQDDEAERSSFSTNGKPEPQSGLALHLVPPLQLAIDCPEERFERLSLIAADYTVPRLLALHDPVQRSVFETPVPDINDVRELGRLILGPDGDVAAGYVLKLRDQGVSLDELYSLLLGPTAGHLGELWDQDQIDFVDVTLGVARLQRLVITFEGLDQVLDGEDKKKIMIVGAPGEQHSFGNAIIQRFFRASGWQVWNCIAPNVEDVGHIAVENWFPIIGFSFSLDTHFEALREAIARIRALSLNERIGIIVGGSAINRNPEWPTALGADGSASSGPAAVLLANRLLAEALK